uniref:Membrane protein, putative n=1 Tax=Rheinheimera sp. BAL341 TaxID=1708203 RepID=A0A486XVC0_9GAMM
MQTAANPSYLQQSDKLLCLLMPFFLLVDCVNGALLQLYGSSYGLAILYKSILLTAMALVAIQQQPKWMWGLLLILTAMLIGPSLHWQGLPQRWLLADLQLAVKVLSPLLALLYLSDFVKRAPQQAQQLLTNSLQVSVVVLLLNALAGLMGFGFTAYQPLEGVAQSFLGIKGFFYSTNELSAVLLVITAALLGICWPRNKLAYVLCSSIALLLALSLLTKTGLFGVLLLVLLMPLLMQPKVFWHQQKTLLLMLCAALLVLLLLLLANAEPLLRLLGIYDKLSFVYQQRGITGIVLSSRDYYAGQIWQISSVHYTDWQQWLGLGQGGVALHLKKYFAELDWFDLTVFYGVAGLAAFVMTFALFIRHSWRQSQHGVGRVLLLLNLLLLLVSSFAGHILTSGMLWLPWALCNALLLQSAAVKPIVAEIR